MTAKTCVMKQGIKECFKEDFEFFNIFMDSYTELLNKNLTKYYNIIEEIITTENKLKNYGGDQNIISVYFKQLLEVMLNLESVLSLYEAIIQTAPDILDIKSLSFTRFSLLLSNLSSRFLGNPYYKSVNELSVKFNSKEYIQVYIKLFYILITFSNSINEKKMKNLDNEIYENVLLALSKSDINTKNLANFVEDLKNNDLFKHDFKDEFFLVSEFINKLTNTNFENLKNQKVRILIILRI